MSGYVTLLSLGVHPQMMIVTGAGIPVAANLLSEFFAVRVGCEESALAGINFVLWLKENVSIDFNGVRFETCGEGKVHVLFHYHHLVLKCPHQLGSCASYSLFF